MRTAMALALRPSAPCAGHEADQGPLADEPATGNNEGCCEWGEKCASEVVLMDLSLVQLDHAVRRWEVTPPHFFSTAGARRTGALVHLPVAGSPRRGRVADLDEQCADSPNGDPGDECSD